MTTQPRTGGLLSGAAADKRLRLSRSRRYLEALAQLDAGGHHCDPAVLQQLLAAIAEELPEVRLEDRPSGIVAECYLGPPYEVHTLDLEGSIIRHYRRGEALPPLLEAARGLALHPAYSFIEVYGSCLRAVSGDGQVHVVRG